MEWLNEDKRTHGECLRDNWNRIADISASNNLKKIYQYEFKKRIEYQNMFACTKDEDLESKEKVIFFIKELDYIYSKKFNTYKYIEGLYQEFKTKVTEKS